VVFVPREIDSLVQVGETCLGHEPRIGQLLELPICLAKARG
jgi:hypothetical protein